MEDQKTGINDLLTTLFTKIGNAKNKITFTVIYKLKKHFQMKMQIYNIYRRN